MSDGLVVVDKPGGPTSHDVVARVRRLAGTRKVGHAGTLDPMATGVLVLGVGRATRLLGHLTLTDKAYDATIRLGRSTTTDDAEGEVVADADPTDLAAVTDDRVRAGLAALVGELDQRPSAVSAVKVDGRRAYDRVRAGEQVELPPRRVRIEALDVLDVRRATDHLDVDVAVRCSSGTYVRAIARDLGQALAVGGHLTALRRTAVGPFTLAHSRTLEEHQDRLELTPLDAAARALFRHRDLTEEQARDVGYGRRLLLDLGAGGPVALFAPDGRFLALYEHDPERAVEAGGPVARAVAVFA